MSVNGHKGRGESGNRAHGAILHIRRYVGRYSYREVLVGEE